MIKTGITKIHKTPEGDFNVFIEEDGDPDFFVVVVAEMTELEARDLRIKLENLLTEFDGNGKR